MTARRHETTPATEQPIVVLLSSYNGARFIAQQIESIRAQSYGGWTLLVRDDGSSDDTVPIVRCLAAEDPRITLIEDARGNLGPPRSFGALMQVALEGSAEYVALADQDDVWHPDKLQREVEALCAHERRVGRATPILLHTDLSVVDEELRVIHPSFLASQGLRHQGVPPLPMLLTQNFVSGCTVLVNRALLHAALPVPDDAVMHDWWLALCAAALGMVVSLPGSTVRYRQHGANVAGSRSRARGVANIALHPMRWWRESGATFSATVRQACALARRIEREAQSAPAARVATVRDYCEAFASGTGALERLRAVRRHGVGPRSILGYPLVFYLRILLWPPDRARASRDPRR